MSKLSFTQTTLLPCPFCGSERPNSDLYYGGFDGAPVRYSVWCWNPDCGASVIRDNFKDAEDAWNARV